jgi:hypothetical protein
LPLEASPVQPAHRLAIVLDGDVDDFHISGGLLRNDESGRRA